MNASAAMGKMTVSLLMKALPVMQRLYKEII